jgi:diguanylate cyclase (GGDEF)-like protein/PAS domain S-box-containing protein
MTGPGGAKPARRYDKRLAGDETNLGLLSPGGPFEDFPGPVLVVARNGVVLSANPRAEPLSRLLQGGMTVELRDALNAALAGKVAQVTPLLLGRTSATEDAGQALDLVVLPWAEGAAALLLGRDITLERSLRSALIDSRQRYKDLVEASSDFAWEVDAEGRFAFVSPRGALGFAASELVGQRVQAFLLEAGETEASPFATRVPVDQVEVWFRDADGKAACLSATGLPLHGPDGEWLGVRGTCRDITDERSREAALSRARHRQQLLAYILRMVRDELEPARLLMAAAEALVPALPALGVAIYCRGSGDAFACVAQAGSKPPQTVLAPLLARLAAGEALLEAHDEAGCLLLRATRYQGRVNGALCLWRGISEDVPGEEESILLDEVSAQIGVTNQLLAREEELEKLSSTDPLTGLLNRRSFVDRLEQHFARPESKTQAATLFYMDLDNFKLVNDRHGHQAGDKALLALTEILRTQGRTGDLAARLGGDEFALFCAGMPAAIAEEKGRALLEAAAALAHFTADPELPLGLSVGIAAFDPGTAEDLQSLLDRADTAMYAVKRRGKGGLEFAPPMEDGTAT